MLSLVLFLASLLGQVATPAAGGPPADLVLLSAKIWTGDPAHPEAQALAVEKGRIVALGPDAEIGKRRGSSTVVIDGKNRSRTLDFA